ncbi:MAG: ABC transporter ATP-binding protein [Anaerolineales bacterium]|nr:ABC transporter ATP-binding protein [Anaerolineales bacterium]MCB9127507.1 ABC transporter ATP-binding protein [Ardenticatenales bacterium]
MPIHHDNSPPPQAQTGAPSILVRELNYRYPDGFHALRGLSVAIAPGERVGLVGPNGAGKSTFMLHLNGLLSGEGEIRIAGLPLSKEKLPEVRALVGMVFQNPDDQLFSPTVFDDVAFGPLHMGYGEEEVRQRVAEALAAVGMADFAERMPYHLSVGQKKRVSLATVLAMGPELLVLDEPSAGLDPRGRRQLIELLDGMALTMLVSTHDMRLVDELFPRILVMDAGQIVYDGETSAVLNDDAFLRAHGLEKP